MTATRETSPQGSWWDWTAVWFNSTLHVGFPFMNWICRYEPRWTPEQMGSKSGQVSLLWRTLTPGDPHHWCELWDGVRHGASILQLRRAGHHGLPLGAACRAGHH